MAPSADSTKPPKRNARWPPNSPALEIASVAIGLVFISLVLFAYERALIPLYATGPTTYLLNKFVLTSILLAIVNPLRLSPVGIWVYTAISLAFAPNATYWVAVWTSRMKDPLVGPAIAHATVLLPLIFFLTSSVAEAQLTTTQRHMKISPPFIYRVASAALCFVAGTVLPQRVWGRAAFLYNISESQIFLALSGASFCLWVAKSRMFPYEKHAKHGTLSGAQMKSIYIGSFAVVWVVIHRFLASPVLPHPLKGTYTHPSIPIQIHSSVQSVTGLIVVGEALPPTGYDGGDDQEMHSVRYLRASHSILGGVWMGAKVNVLDDEPPLQDSLGKPLGDSIYSTFVLQEAVRLVNSTEKGKIGRWEDGLIIGLGAGTSATSFIRHGISTSIIEIDPAVYNATRTYFGLPDPGPGKVFLEDARSWVERKSASVQAGNDGTKFDFVVHDCFSGGGVPEHIFTMEFWKDLKTLMDPEGIIVVNFAGILKSDSTKMVLHTLEKSFGQCRAFHDLFGVLFEEQYEKEFINVVFFCTTSEAPLTFRESRKADWLGSPLRRHVLNSLSMREVDLDLIRNVTDGQDNNKYLLTDAHNPLGKLQDEQGLHHWKLMREVLSDVHWETY